MKLLLALFLATSPAFAAGEDWDPARMEESVGMEPFGPPITDQAEIDRRTAEITHGLRCPVCQGMSVAASDTEAALNMKARVEELVAQGYTDEQIEDFFVVRYSTWILLEPPKEGLNWLVWAGPGGAAAVGGLIVFAIWSRRRRQEPAPAPEGEFQTEDPYEQQVLKELDS